MFSGIELCTAPWRRITLAENRFRPCCRIVGGEYARFPKTVEELMSYVNCEFMQKLRRRIYSGDIAGTICENCVRSGLNEPFFYDYPVETPIRLDLIKNAREGVKKGVEMLEGPPLEIGIAFPSICNIHCKMCTVHGYIKQGKVRKGAAFLDQAKNLLLEIGFKNLVYLAIGGGEPLFNRSPIELMKFVADRMNPEMVMSTGTNGKTLNKHIDLLKRFPNLDMNISVDATGGGLRVDPCRHQVE